MSQQQGPFGERNDALDGLRAVAVVGVLAFHTGAGWAAGGFLGVSLFFTLSGFLITSLLLNESFWTDTIDLRGFWGRRFRRLMPASLVAIAMVVVVSLFWDPSLASIRGDVIAALLYVANWRSIIDGQSYSDLFASPSPLLHFWSLAIEEQFYVVFPLVFLGLHRLGAGRRTMIAALASLGVLGSALPVLLGAGTDRLYYGADARAAEVLIGSCLAVVLVRRGRYQQPEGRWAQAARLLGPVGFIGLLAAWSVVEQGSDFLPRGGLAAHAAVTCVIIVAALQPQSLFRRALGFGPLPWLGRISYGLYLFHWPIFVWLDANRVGVSGFRLHAVRIAVSFAAATVSYYLVERRTPRVASALGPRRLAATGVIAVAGLIAVAAAAPEDTDPLVIDAGLANSARSSVIEGASPDAFIVAASDPDGPITVGEAVDIVLVGFGDPGDGDLDPAVADQPAFDYESDATRTVVLGDSSALMMAIGLGHWTQTNQDQVQLLNLARVGCGLTRSDVRQMQPDVPTDNRAKCGDWEPAYATLRDEVRPEVVVMSFGLWELVTHQVDASDEPRHLGDAEFDDHVRSEIAAATAIFTDAGTPVVWLTAPRISVSLGRPQLGGGSWGAEDPERVDRLNDLITSVSDENPLAAVVDLHGWFEDLPDGPFDPSLRPDGVHVTWDSSPVVGEWLGPAIVDASEPLLDTVS